MKKSIVGAVVLVFLLLVISIIIQDESNEKIEQEVTESCSNSNICSEEQIETIDITEEQTENEYSYCVTDEEYNKLK